MTFPIRYPYPTHEYDYEETIHPPTITTFTGTKITKPTLTDDEAEETKLRAFLAVDAALNGLSRSSASQVLQAILALYDLG